MSLFPPNMKLKTATIDYVLEGAILNNSPFSCSITPEHTDIHQVQLSDLLLYLETQQKLNLLFL